MGSFFFHGEFKRGSRERHEKSRGLHREIYHRFALKNRFAFLEDFEPEIILHFQGEEANL
jgi:hypothetical protein